MYTTVETVKEVTGYDVTLEDVTRAQFIIESYTGKVEVEVGSAFDLALLDRATAYQAAYMKNNPSMIYEQVALTQIAQFGQAMVFRNDGATPWVAPLAVLACNRLSWKGTRSVKTGSIFSRPPAPPVVRDWWFE